MNHISKCVEFVAIWVTLASEFFAFQYLLAAVWLSDAHRGYALVLLISMLIKWAVSKWIKFIAGLALPAWLTQRPSCERCSLLAQPADTCASNVPVLHNALPVSTGFPSGHAWHAVSFATMVTLHTNGSIENRLVLFSYLLAILTCWSRIWLRCHTIIQVLAGTCIGMAWGIGLYYCTSSGRDAFFSALTA